MSERVMVFIPMYNCGPQIGRVLDQFDTILQSSISEIVVVDNGSQDDGVQVVRQKASAMHGVKVALLSNTHNVGLGGSHKVAFDYAIDGGFDYCIVLHGDDQADIRDAIPLIRDGKHRDVDCLLGSRFMRGSRLLGYSRFRTFGNLVFNRLFSFCTWRRLEDLGAGLNIYSVEFLKKLPYKQFPNNLTFNYHAILQTSAMNAKFEFFPISWREHDQRSNVKLARQAVSTLRMLSHYYFRRKAFLTTFSEPESIRYEANVVYRNASRSEAA